MSFKSKFLPLVYENVRMIVNLPTRHFWRYHSSKHFREFYLQDGGENSAGMDMNRNYVTVTLCIPPPYVYLLAIMRYINRLFTYLLTLFSGLRQFVYLVRRGAGRRACNDGYHLNMSMNI